MAFTRQSVLLKWNSGSVARAFPVLKEGYRGGAETKPATYSRSLYDDSLQVVRGISKRKFSGVLSVLDAPAGAIDGVAQGSIAEARAAHAAADLQVRSFEDDAYWEAEWMGDWDAICEYDPMRNRAIIVAQIEEK